MTTDDELNENRAKILVVEDEAVIAMDIEARLEALGYVVVGVSARGDKAIELAESSRPDLALMDINILGPMNGIQTARELRERFDLPSIFLTAYSDDETIKAASGSEALGYLIKPFADREVRASVEFALYRHKAERQLAEYREKLRKKVIELEQALREVRELSALLPICAWCKKIRDEDGYWEEVSAYISERTRTKFTHGICESCEKKMIEEINKTQSPD
jgi:DNA-binding response OmpR family regulator